MEIFLSKFFATLGYGAAIAVSVLIVGLAVLLIVMLEDRITR